MSRSPFPDRMNASMSGPLPLPRISGSSSGRTRRGRPPRLKPDPAGDPIEQPINLGPPEEDGDPAAESPFGDAPDPDNDDSTQPNDENWVTEDMSTLALNPGSTTSEYEGSQFRSADLERLAEAEGRAQALHLNGDFRDMDDAAIMLELKAGNMSGFDFLLQKYRKPIINFMYRMTRNQAVAEELAQEVFLRVYRSRETYRAEARFSTWLYRIATNLGVNQARDTRHERSASTVYLDETDSETGTSPDVADATPGAEARLLRDERMSAIRDFVEALPERQRMGVMMHKYEGMDYKQIGEVLKLSESATKSLLFRAYQTLREKLKGFV